ncbi:Uncharacterised protein [Mycobacteroides abscessus subsp. abscessus]|nr:Uncharacterised protein [Mycobacteroides abscessus subsp. abscessus]
MHRHDRVPVVDAHLEQEVVAQHARIVDDDRRSTELSDNLLDGSVDRCLVGDVGAHGDRFAAARGDCGYGVGACRGVEIEHCDGKSVVGKPFRDCGADSARCSGDDRYLLGHGVSSVVRYWGIRLCWM